MTSELRIFSFPSGVGASQLLSTYKNELLPGILQAGC